MANAGDVFTLHDGERVTVRRTAADSNGELLEVEAEWAPAEHRPPVHFHPDQDERFEIHEGELSVEIEGTTHVLGPGDALDVPRGAVHRMWPSGAGTTRASWQVRPALRTEDFFEAVHAVRASGRHGKGGMLTPLGAGVVLSEYRDEFRMPIPAALQRPVLALLAGIARLRGYPALG
ncbi:MAG TPA: cupin domain-containing protein [Solirubrobacterales bacterium]